jgi:hypothetical protein
VSFSAYHEKLLLSAILRGGSLSSTGRVFLVTYEHNCTLLEIGVQTTGISKQGYVLFGVADVCPLDGLKRIASMS